MGGRIILINNSQKQYVHCNIYAQQTTVIFMTVCSKSPLYKFHIDSLRQCHYKQQQRGRRVQTFVLFFGQMRLGQRGKHLRGVIAAVKFSGKLTECN